jgi:hypothetical protein
MIELLGRTPREARNRGVRTSGPRHESSTRFARRPRQRHALPGALVSESSGSTDGGGVTDHDAARGSHDEATPRVASRTLRDAVDLLELPITLVDLNDLIVVGASETARRYLVGATGSVIGRSVSEIFHYEDETEFLAPLRAMQRRDIDFYRAHRVPAASEPTVTQVTAWVRSVDVGNERFALVEVAPAGEDSRSPIADFLG